MRRGGASRVKLGEIGNVRHPNEKTLAWFRSDLVSAGHVVGRIGKRLACLVGVLLEPGAGFSDCVLRTVIPGDTRLAVEISPFAVHIAERSVGFAAFLQRDHEGASVTITDGPFADVAPSRRPRGISGGGGRFTGAGKLYPRDFSEIEALPMAIFEDNDDRSGAGLGRCGRLGKSVRRYGEKQCNRCSSGQDLAHGSLLAAFSSTRFERSYPDL